MRPISTLLVAWIVASAVSDAHAEQPFSLFLLPPLLDDLIEMVVPLQVNSDLGPNRNIQFWILESRYCGASADRAGKFVAIAVPGLTREGKVLRTLGAEDCRRSLIEVATTSAAARRDRAWVAAVSLRAVWKSSRLEWKLMDAQAVGAGDGVAPTFSIPSGGLTIAEIETSDVRVAIDDQLDLTVQLAPAFFDDFAHVSVSRIPLKSAPTGGPAKSLRGAALHPRDRTAPPRDRHLDFPARPDPAGAGLRSQSFWRTALHNPEGERRVTRPRNLRHLGPIASRRNRRDFHH